MWEDEEGCDDDDVRIRRRRRVDLWQDDVHHVRIRYAVEPGDVHECIYSNECLAYPVDSWPPLVHPYAYPLKNKRWLSKPTSIDVYLGLCFTCGIEDNAGARFVRSPLWEPGIAIFACTHILKIWHGERLWKWREWHMAWFLIFKWFPVILPAAQALAAWGRKRFLTVPAPIYLTDIDPPEDDEQVE
jgi:hypothetical protein